MSARAAVSRADLVRCLQVLDGAAMARWGLGLGYELKHVPSQETLAETVSPPELPAAPAMAQSEARPSPEREVQPPRMGPRRMPTLHFWRVKFWRAKTDEEVNLEGPAWFRLARPFKAGELVSKPQVRPPRSRPLAAWSKLWPLLRKLLGTQRRSGRVELSLAVARCARARPLYPLPEQAHWGWANQIQLWVDRRPLLAPFWSDFGQLVEGLQGLCGRQELDVRQLDQGILGLSRPWGRFEAEEPLQLPKAATAVLVLSDLGCYDEDPRGRGAWLAMGRRLRAAGIQAVALVPCPPRRWQSLPDDPWQVVFWDRRLKQRCRLAPNRAQTQAPLGAEIMVRLLSAAVLVEPALLRALRLRLPGAYADVGSEWETWWHPSMSQAVQSVSLKEDAWEAGRADYGAMPLAAETVALIREYHRHLSPFIQAEEYLVGQTLLGFGQAEDELMARVVRSLGPDALTSLRAWFGRLGRRQHAAMWANPQLASAYLRAFPDQAMPAGLRPETVSFAQQGEPRDYKLKVVGTQWILNEHPGQGSPLLSVRSRGYLGVEQAGANQAYRLGEAPFPAGFGEGESLTLHTDVASYELERVSRPDWAEAMGRDGLGLFVQYQGRKLYWLNPGEIPVEGLGVGWKKESGRWLDEQQFRVLSQTGIPCPKGASRMGLDEIGVYADYAYKDITWRMRLILPDRFMMGSPKGEPERDDRELLHEVILSRAFWLAETACTQALWQAVMGKNPSHFKGENRPVENVSWQDVQGFLKKLGNDYDLRLPSEAEWEFACRAGTQTPFSFGELLDWRQVNFNARFPYDHQPPGKKRGETVGVKDLPANAWGLYQMHGNIWEWCADYFGVYAPGTSVDPGGPGTGARRVLRGGGWGSSGRRARAAYRSAIEPGYRVRYCGFRLARGQGLK